MSGPLGPVGDVSYDDRVDELDPLDPTPDAVGETCKAEGSGVSGVDSCEAGAMCWDVDARALEGHCIEFCQSLQDIPHCPPGTTCWLVSDGVLILCLPICDPLSPDCPEDEPCLPYVDNFICGVDLSGEDGHYGDPCEYWNACDPGLLCLNPEYVPDCPAAGCCTPFCDTSKPNSCPGEGQECIPWYEEGSAPEGYENLGVCQIPQ